MSSGIRVFFIQNAPVEGLSYSKVMPARGASVRRPMSPCARCAGVRARSTWRTSGVAPVVIVAVPRVNPLRLIGREPGSQSESRGQYGDDDEGAHASSVAAIDVAAISRDGGVPARRRRDG